MSEILRTIVVDGIGPVVFRNSHRARRIVISVNPCGEVHVSVPVRASLSRALAFVDLKKGWIFRHLAKTEQIKKSEAQFEELIETIDAAAAAENLIGRLRFLAQKNGFSCNKVTVRMQKTRWGACSPQNNISLNLKLAVLPGELIDYVIMHELVHTRFHDHSRKFWAELDKYIPQSKLMAKRLRTDGLKLP